MNKGVSELFELAPPEADPLINQQIVARSPGRDRANTREKRPQILNNQLDPPLPLYRYISPLCPPAVQVEATHSGTRIPFSLAEGFTCFSWLRFPTT
jgi:hypothetical protein